MHAHPGPVPLQAVHGGARGLVLLRVRVLKGMHGTLPHRHSEERGRECATS